MKAALLILVFAGFYFSYWSGKKVSDKWHKQHDIEMAGKDLNISGDFVSIHGVRFSGCLNLPKDKNAFILGNIFENPSAIPQINVPDNVIYTTDGKAHPFPGVKTGGITFIGNIIQTPTGEQPHKVVGSF